MKQSDPRPVPPTANDGALDTLDTRELVEKLRPDRDTAEPIYQQLMKRIVGLIESGEIATGSSLPSERVLAEKLDLSRTTVKRCYAELKSQDYLSSNGRSGVAVKSVPALAPRIGKLKSFTQEMQELGLTPSSRVVEREIVTDRTIASLFGRPSTSRFLRLVRVRLGDDVPLSREVAWYDLGCAPKLAEWDGSGSAYSFLAEQCGIVLSVGEQSIEATLSTPHEMDVFGFDAPGPCLLFKRRSYSVARQMVEYVEGSFRGDAYVYRIQLGA